MRRDLGKLTDEQDHVARHYNSTIFQFESERLEKHCPVEFLVTCRYLERFVPPGAIVADVGAGVGHYSELLARKGRTIHLIDISPALLQAARERLLRAGLGERVKGAHRASATDLRLLESGSVDGVLMLGPLYHLRDPGERRQAVEEAKRILKPGGVLFAAAVNRLAYLRDLFRERPDEAVRRRDFHRRFLSEGNLDPDHAPPIGYAHLTTVSEFRSLLGAAFAEITLVGTDSFTSAWQAGLADRSAEVKEAWLDLVEETGKTLEGLGQSDHFLFVGRRP